MAKERDDKRPGCVVLLPTSDGNYLLERNGSSDEYHPGKLRPPGGHSEKDDADAKATMVRELREEFGLTGIEDKLTYLGRDTRGTSGDPHVFELKAHGLKPGTYQASNSKQEKVKLELAKLDDPAYKGPQLSDLMTPTKSAQANQAPAPLGTSGKVYGGTMAMPAAPKYKPLYGKAQTGGQKFQLDPADAASWTPVNKDGLFSHNKTGVFWNAPTNGMATMSVPDPRGVDSPRWIPNQTSWPANMGPGSYDAARAHHDAWLPAYYKTQAALASSAPQAESSAASPPYGPHVPGPYADGGWYSSGGGEAPTAPAFPPPGDTAVTDPTPNPAFPSGLAANRPAQNRALPIAEQEAQIAANLAQGEDPRHYAGIAKGIAAGQGGFYGRTVPAAQQAAAAAAPANTATTMPTATPEQVADSITAAQKLAAASSRLPNASGHSSIVNTMRPAHAFFKLANPEYQPDYQTPRITPKARPGILNGSAAPYLGGNAVAPTDAGLVPPAPPSATGTRLGGLRAMVGRNKGGLLAGTVGAAATAIPGYFLAQNHATNVGRQQFSNGVMTAAKTVDGQSFWERIWAALKGLFGQNQNMYSTAASELLKAHGAPEGVAMDLTEKPASVRIPNSASLMVFATGLTSR